MLRRFYCPQLTQSKTLALEPREARHAFSVLRFRSGDEVELFDGKGRAAKARILRINAKELKADRAECTT